MDAATLEALKGSIAKWEKIVAGTGFNRGADNCPLCKMFNSPEAQLPSDCIGCPVFDRTGHKYCNKTPYDQYTGTWDDGEKAVFARDELDFLRSLLPTESTGSAP